MPALDELPRRRATLSKFDYAATLVVSLAMLLARQQDPVGLVLFDEAATTVLPPSATQSQVTVMPSLLEKCVPARRPNWARSSGRYRAGSAAAGWSSSSRTCSPTWTPSTTA